MKLRTRLDVFGAALLSALGATQLTACGGSSVFTSGDGAGSGSGGSGNAPGAAGSNPGGSSSSAGASGSNTAGSHAAGSGHGGTGSGGTTGSAGSAGAGGSAGSAINQFPCKNPQDAGSGFVQCDGFKHRREAGTCTSHVPRPNPVVTEAPSNCTYDADCSAKPHGWCQPNIQVSGSSCNYGCVKDSDCGENQLCECGEPVGRCVQAKCSSDADCVSGFLCKSYDASQGCGSIVYACQSPADACGNDLDCDPQLPTGSVLNRKQCVIAAASNSFQCLPGGCAVGRPFLVEGAQRLAPRRTRADWSELALLPRLSQLEATLRAHVAEQWTRVALMEHASIAAFARFSLQLLSLGAPAELIELTTSAMADETRHAKACFAIASAYAGSEIGPGRLAVERSLDDSSLEAIVLNTIREGCVGETVAAIEAREAAEYTTDPALRSRLLVISEDETRHAELAYRFVKWALAQGGPALERAVRREFAALGAEPRAAQRALSAQDEAGLAHGIVPDGLRDVIRARAMADLILPCSRALFALDPRATRTENVSA